MTIMKYIKLLALPALLLAVIITGFSVKKQSGSQYGPDLEQLEGVSEFYYKSKDDSRIWHVINKYSSEISGNAPEYNNSSYLFTSDSVMVINEYVGVISTDFIADK